MNKKILASLFAVGLAAGCVCSSVDAHGVFFANRLDEKVLVLGEGPLDNAYKPEMVTGLVGYDNNGAVIPVEVVKHELFINQSQKYLVLKKVHMLSNMTFTTGMQKQNL